MATPVIPECGKVNGPTTVQAATKPDFPFARQRGLEPPEENARFRCNESVSKVKLFDGTEAWIITKHEDVRSALESNKLSAVSWPSYPSALDPAAIETETHFRPQDRRTPGFPEIHEGGKKALEQRPTFVNLDEPEHCRQRNMFESFFNPEAVQRLQPMIQETVETTLDAMIKKGCQKPVDFIHNFAEPIPIQIIYKILGIPEEDVESLSHHSEARMNTSGNAAESSKNNLAQYISKLVSKKIEEPGEDLISRLVIEQYKTGNLEKEDVDNLVFLIMVAGNAAVTNSIAMGVVTLLHHPSQLEEFKRNPSLAPAVANECLRYNTASALNSRRAAQEDVYIGGKHIHKGEGVICLVQSADRDETYFKDGAHFDIHHGYDAGDTFGFGHGAHRCIAEGLARAEVEVALAALFQRLPDLRLAVPVEELGFTPARQNVGIVEMPVLW
ncbi:MAG: hypothetical protein Q9216_003026 [Gyalolechia sp. 2 TL-2023]